MRVNTTQMQMEKFRHAAPQAEETPTACQPVSEVMWNSNKWYVEKLLCNSVTKRPRSTYKQGFETYKLFLSIHDVVFVHPLISQDILVHFVAYCQHNLFLKFSTIRQYLCGIRYIFLDMGIPNPFESKCHSMNRLKLISNAIRKVQYIGKHFLSSAFR